MVQACWRISSSTIPEHHFKTLQRQCGLRRRIFLHDDDVSFIDILSIKHDEELVLCIQASHGIKNHLRKSS